MDRHRKHPPVFELLTPQRQSFQTSVMSDSPQTGIMAAAWILAFEAKQSPKSGAVFRPVHYWSLSAYSPGNSPPF
jgi:hypothetical protein